MMPNVFVRNFSPRASRSVREGSECCGPPRNVFRGGPLFLEEASATRFGCGPLWGWICWTAMPDATHILSAIEQGDPSAAEQLLPLVYDELRSLAAQRLAQEQAGQSLDATALVHE